MSSVNPTRQPSMAALQREADQYLSKLTGAEKTLKEVALNKVHDYAILAFQTSKLPDMHSSSPLGEGDKNLALNLGVANLKWLENNNYDQIKIGDQTLKEAFFDLCLFCVSEAIAQRDGIKNAPVRPARSASIPVKLDSPPKETPKVPDSPRKKLFRRGKKRADSAPVKPQKNLPSLFVMPSAELDTNGAFVAVLGAFITLQPENQKKVLQWLQSGGKLTSTRTEVMERIKLKSITDMCEKLSTKERALLREKLLSTPSSI